MPSQISEADIQRLVRAFYKEVQDDALLAPIFATKISPDGWETHMDHIADFWSSIFLKAGRFKGNPMIKHAALPGLTPAHFTHWLALFKEVSSDVLEAESANAIQIMAERIAQSLRMGLAFNFEKTGKTDHPFADFGLRVPR